MTPILLSPADIAIAAVLILADGVLSLLLRLSTRERQRLALIRALARAPKMLLAVGNAARDLGRGPGRHPFAMFVRAPLIVAAVGLFGLYEATMMALLPIWGVRLGLSPSQAAATLSAVYFGSVALQMPIGWLSDKTARLAVLRVCGGVGLAGAIGLATVAAPAPALFGVIAVWGGIASAIYSVALSMAGDRFRSSELVSTNAALILTYGLGALVGPGLGGAAMDVWDPQRLFGFFAVLFAVFVVATFVGGGRGRR